MTTTTHTSSTPSGSWVDGPMVGFDLETTGVDRFSDVPVSAALVVAEGGKVLSTDYFIIDPGRLIPPGASAIHGISTEQARSEGISLTEALARIYDAISAAQAARWPIVGMNLSYDLTMLDVLHRAHLGCEISPAGLYVLDALVIDRHIDTYRRGKRKLVNLAEHYGVALPDAHNAAADAVGALFVVGAELRRCPDLAASTLADLSASQAIWHHTWATSYSSYRVEHGMAPLDPADFEWPIARGKARTAVPSDSPTIPSSHSWGSAPTRHRGPSEARSGALVPNTNLEEPTSPTGAKECSSMRPSPVSGPAALLMRAPDDVSAASDADLAPAGDAQRSREHKHAMQQHVEQMQPGEGSVEWELLEHWSYLMEQELYEATWRARHEITEPEARCSGDFFD